MEGNKININKTLDVANRTVDNSLVSPYNQILDSTYFSEKEQMGPQNFMAHKLLGKGSFGDPKTPKPQNPKTPNLTHQFTVSCTKLYK